MRPPAAVLRSPAPELSKTALEAVSQWRYKLTLLNSEPIEVLTILAVEFQLEH